MNNETTNSAEKQTLAPHRYSDMAEIVFRDIQLSPLRIFETAENAEKKVEVENYLCFQTEHTLRKAFRHSPFQPEEIRLLVTTEFEDAKLTDFTIVKIASDLISAAKHITSEFKTPAIWNHLVMLFVITERRHELLLSKIARTGCWYRDDDSAKGIFF